MRRQLAKDRYGEGGRSPRLEPGEAHVLVPSININEVEFVTEAPALQEIELPSEEDSLMIEVDESGREHFRRRHPYHTSNRLRDSVNSHRCLKRCGFARLKRIFLCLAFVSVVTTMVSAFFLLSLSLAVKMKYSAEDCRQLAQRAMEVDEIENISIPPTPLRLFSTSRRLTGDPTDDVRWNFSGWEVLKLNQFRWLGTHNSYHVSSPLPIAPHHYSHAPLVDQLGWYDHGVRQVELDLHLIDDVFVVYHLHFVDDATTCYCLTQCLRELRDWSDTHPLHFPIFVFLEIKSKVWEDVKTALTGFSNQHLVNLELEISSVFPKKRILTPDQVRGNYSNLRKALVSQDAGWPSLVSTLGKFVFVWLDDVHGIAEHVPELQENPGLRGRLFFIAQRDLQQPYASIVVLNDPREEGYTENVRAALDQGYLVRSMSDSPNNLKKDPERFRMIYEAGAQILTTDFECINRSEIGFEWRNDKKRDYNDELDEIEYCETLPFGRPFECNTNAPPICWTFPFFGQVNSLVGRVSWASETAVPWSSHEGWLAYFLGLLGF